MGSWKYIPLLILCFSPSSLGTNPGDNYDEDAATKRFSPPEDTEVFRREAKTFGEDYGKSWILMPDGNGTAHVAVLQKHRASGPLKTLRNKYSFEVVTESTTFYYYNRHEEEGVEFKLKDVDKLDFDPSKPTKVLVHGWRSSRQSPIIKEVKDVYLAEKDVNVFGVDWSPIAADLYYPNPAGATEQVGKVLGVLIGSLVETHEANYSDIHIIGHSLGAHISGFAGDYHKGRVGRITGLDPALPGFGAGTSRLDDTDAQFVDIIHTCSGVLGIASPIGHVDFYPNGGSVFQPGCASKDIQKAPQACSHSRSVLFFMESISKKSNFEAVRCEEWAQFKLNECGQQYSVMGENIPRNTSRGVYYLKTNKKSPFSRGRAGTVY